MCSIPLPSNSGEIAAGQAFEGVPACIPIRGGVGVVFDEKIYSHGKCSRGPITRFMRTNLFADMVTSYHRFGDADTIARQSVGDV